MTDPNPPPRFTSSATNPSNRYHTQYDPRSSYATQLSAPSGLNMDSNSDSNSPPDQPRKLHMATSLPRHNHCLDADDQFDDPNNLLSRRPNPNRYSTYLPPSSPTDNFPEPAKRIIPDAVLLFMTPHGGRTEFSLQNPTTTIGRKEENTIVLQDGKISKFHAAIERTDSGYILKDRNSSNGVKLNDVFISQAVPLADGDRIQIGSIVLTFYFVDEPDGQDPSSSHYHANGPSNLLQSFSGGGPGASYALGTIRRRKHESDHLDLVTILPNEKKYDETVSIRAEIDDTSHKIDFPVVDEIMDMDTLKQDYEKLRFAYELSKSSYTSGVNDHLTKMLDLMFSVLPVDRGVVLLVDKATSLLVTTMVKLRENKGYEAREILLSSTILQRVYKTRKCLITSDACEDPDLGKSKSIARGQIRSVICVPVIAHEEVLGIVHLDSRDRINTFIEKDLGLVQTIINQTALQIENSKLFSQLQSEIRISEQLKRFLPPQVISRMEKKEGVIKKGGRETTATIVFADIRGFTRMSEKISPTEVFDLLNDYFERLVQIVFKYNGVVDKFIGDELMAVFGTLGDDDNADPTYSVLNSVMAALEFKKAITDMNNDRMQKGKDPIAIGVGLNTGRLITGFMGSSQRLEYTCIGDTVNLASRICGFAAPDQVLLSEETTRYVARRVECRFHESRQFKGKERETRVYEAISVIQDGYLENASEVSVMSG